MEEKEYKLVREAFLNGNSLFVTNVTYIIEAKDKDNNDLRYSYNMGTGILTVLSDVKEVYVVAGL